MSDKEPDLQTSAPAGLRTSMLLLSLGVGLALIFVIVPLSQFLTIGAGYAEVETSTPVGWAVGLIFSAALALAAIRLIARTRRLGKGEMVILYCMLTIAVPIMNLGLVRQMYLAMTGTQYEFLRNGNNTYRKSYAAQDDAWFPKVPTAEGLAFAQAERLIRLVEDRASVGARGDAKREVKTAIQRTAARLKHGREVEPAGEDIKEAIGKLGHDDVVSLQKLNKPEATKALGIATLLEQRAEQAAAESAEALETLTERLPKYDEFMASRLPQNFDDADLSSKNRIENEYTRLRGQMSEEERQSREARFEQLKQQAPELGRLIASLSSTDREKVRQHLQTEIRQEYREMSEAQFEEHRAAFAYRLLTDERRDIMSYKGIKTQQPNADFLAFLDSVFQDKKSQNARDQAGMGAMATNVGTSIDKLPWSIWIWPSIMWGLLVTTLFLLLMVGAEWLRRKWVDREHLAFPLVEVADHIIRHDYELETASDITSPARRPAIVNPILLAGIGVGFLILSLGALQHYGFSNMPTLDYNLSKELFTSGVWKSMKDVVLVISPIVVGLAFLLSLEVSFSIWISFILYHLITAMARQANLDIVDQQYSGWGGGRFFPFPMEQMIGASICYTALLMWRARGGDKDQHLLEPEKSYLPGPWRMGLLIGAPVLLIALLFHYGINSFGGWAMLIVLGLFLFSQVVASARVRAETGLPLQHTSYEYAKLPMVLGIASWSGSSVFLRYLSLVFLPVSLLFRSLPQQLENIELARRNRVPYRFVAIASVLAFGAALVLGMFWFLVQSHIFGGIFYAGDGDVFTSGPNSFALARYPLWIAHFLGANAVTEWDFRGIRFGFMLLGFGLFGLLAFLRGRFLRFPLHPIGYLVVLMTIFYNWVSPYHKEGGEASLVWGGVLIAWLLKKLIIKYGGMHSYKQAKPFFIGLVVGSVLALFAWNMTDLLYSMGGLNAEDPSELTKHFLDKAPYSPRFY